MTYFRHTLVSPAAIIYHDVLPPYLRIHQYIVLWRGHAHATAYSPAIAELRGAMKGHVWKARSLRTRALLRVTLLALRLLFGLPLLSSASAWASGSSPRTFLTGEREIVRLHVSTEV